MLVAVGCGAHAVALLQRAGVHPVELAPGRSDFDQPLQLRMMPVQVTAAAADMRHHQVALRIVGVGGVQFVHRPGARLQGAGRELVPFKGAHQAALVIEREAWFAVAQEDDVAIAAGAGVAAPFGAWIADKASGFVELLDQFHRLVPAAFGNVEIVGRVAQHIETGHIAAVAQVIAGVVGADGVVRVYVQVGVQRAQGAVAGLDVDPGACRRQ